MPQKLTFGNFELVAETCEFNKNSIKSYNDESDKGYVLKVHIQYSENLQNLHNNLTFLTERMTSEKVEKLATKMRDKGYKKFKTRIIID